MTSEEVTKYWIPAVGAIYGRYEVSYETCMELDTLLGVEEYHQYLPVSPNKPLTEDIKKLLVLLAGPHSKTILKMYRIRRGLE